MKGFVYAVNSRPGDDDEDTWTLSTDPNEDGWNTDSGYPGYGLPKAVAEEYVRLINQSQDVVALMARLRTAVQLSDTFIAENVTMLESTRLPTMVRKIENAIAYKKGIRDCCNAILKGAGGILE